jgi:hypothetical protein
MSSQWSDICEMATLNVDVQQSSAMGQAEQPLIKPLNQPATRQATRPTTQPATKPLIKPRTGQPASQSTDQKAAPVSEQEAARRSAARLDRHLKLMADMQNYFNISRSTAEYLKWRSKYEDYDTNLQNTIVKANSAVHWGTLKKEFSIENEEILLGKYRFKYDGVYRNPEDAGGWRIVTHKRRRKQRQALDQFNVHV